MTRECDCERADRAKRDEDRELALETLRGLANGADPTMRLEAARELLRLTMTPAYRVAYPDG